MGDDFVRLGLDRYNGDRWSKDGQHLSEGIDSKQVARLWRRSSYKKLDRDPFAMCVRDSAFIIELINFMCRLPEEVQNDLAMDQFI